MSQSAPEISVPPDQLGREVRSVMTPGVVTMPEDASVAQVSRALKAHGVHAVLIVAGGHRTPLGWATVHGLVGMVGRDLDLVEARDAVVERAVVISPSASLADAARALVDEGVTHLVVARNSRSVPEGVVSEGDLISGGH